MKTFKGEKCYFPGEKVIAQPPCPLANVTIEYPRIAAVNIVLRSDSRFFCQESASYTPQKNCLSLIDAHYNGLLKKVCLI